MSGKIVQEINNIITSLQKVKELVIQNDSIISVPEKAIPDQFKYTIGRFTVTEQLNNENKTKSRRGGFIKKSRKTRTRRRK